MATTPIYEIPTVGNNQTFVTTLAGVVYTFTLLWSSTSSVWLLNIADSTGAPLVQGIPLVPGADLLEQYPDMNFGGKLFVQVDNDVAGVPGYPDLGTTSHLYFMPV